MNMYTKTPISIKISSDKMSNKRFISKNRDVRKFENQRLIWNTS